MLYMPHECGRQMQGILVSEPEQVQRPVYVG